jgi:hypothetical protein
MNLIKPVYDPSEDYEESYGRANYKDRTILEIGADVGSTATFFLLKGAKKVISVEGNEESYSKLVNNTKDIPEVTPIFKKISSTDHIRELIKEYNPDFLHMDCEFCEKHLNGLERPYFDNIKTIQLEVHCDRELNKIIFDCLLNMDYKVYEFTLHRSTTVKILDEKDTISGAVWILLADKQEI